MSQTSSDARRRIWAIIEALAAASTSDDLTFASRFAISEEFEQLEIALRLRGFWPEP